MDKTILDLSRQKIEYAGLASSLDGDPAALLFVSFTGDDQAELVAASTGWTPGGAHTGTGTHPARGFPAQQDALLKVRKSASAC